MILTHLALFFFEGAGGVAVDGIAVPRPGGSSKRYSGKRPNFWWEHEEPKERAVPYRPPEVVQTAARFDATPDKAVIPEVQDVRAKRSKRRAMLERIVAVIADDE